MREADRPQSPAVSSRLALLRSRMNVGRQIVEWRLKLGLTQDEVARRAATKQSRVSELETLGGNVRFDTLDRIALALGLEITLRPRPDVQQAARVVSASPARESTYTAAGPASRVAVLPLQVSGI